MPRRRCAGRCASSPGPARARRRRSRGASRSRSRRRAFAPEQIMAVTFTEKAAGQLKARLAALGVQRVRASTFHSAALRQLRHFAPGDVGRVLPSKALALRQLANALPAPYKFRPAGDLATEIEWAKNRRIAPEDYRAAARDREPPIPADLMHRIYRDYEQRKAAEGAIDFEDLLALAVELFERDDGGSRGVPRAVPGVHGRRVPGRQPAAAVAARPVARRPRRPVRRGRRLPVDLRVHRREPVAPARHSAALPAGARRPARGELPLDAAGARPGEPARVRRSAVPRRCCGRRSPPGRSRR